MPAFGTILTGDALAMLRTLPDQSVHCCVTSPPYWGLRDYGVLGQIGLESSPQEYIAALMPIFHEVHRVLRADGTLWLNLGDSYIGYHGNKNAHGSAAPSDKNGYRENMRPTSVGADGLKNKDMAGIPWRVAFALQDAGWYLRCDVIWAKPNPMPESVQDRPTRAHEYLFLFSKLERYYYDHEAVREPSAPSRKGNAKTFRGSGAYTGGRSFDNSTDAVRDSHGNAPQGDKRHNVPLNPLYGMGFSRVGCMPCIQSNKQDIRLTAQKCPEAIAKIRQWEGLVRAYSRLGQTTFFHQDTTGSDVPVSIDDVVRWSMTRRGTRSGRQFDMLALAPPPTSEVCVYAGGLCE